MTRKRNIIVAPMMNKQNKKMMVLKRRMMPSSNLLMRKGPTRQTSSQINPILTPTPNPGPHTISPHNNLKIRRMHQTNYPKPMMLQETAK